MSTQGYFNDASANEIYLLENIRIQGRKTEIRQLLKLLNLSKNGQAKAVLVTGDAGIGKSALLDAFVEVIRSGVYCRILDLRQARFQTVEQLYVAFIEGLLTEADAILDDALVAVNEVVMELGLEWQRQDLVRAIALVKLQESIGGKTAVSHDQLARAIRSSVPTVKKLKFSVNDSIDKLVSLIVNPWIMVATSLLNPMNPQLREAIEVARYMKDGGRIAPTGGQNLHALGQGAVTEDAEEDPAEPGEIQASTSVIHIHPEEPTLRLLTAESGINGYMRPDYDVPYDSTEAYETVDRLPASFGRAASPAILLESPARSRAQHGYDGLLRHLINVLNFINNALGPIDSSLLVMLDEWDRVLTAEDQSRAELKEFMTDLLRETTDQKDYRLMLVLSVRTEGESYSLGGSLYNLFRTKLLLPGLADNAARKLVRLPLKQAGIELDEEVFLEIFALAKGNPFWSLKMAHYLKERAEANRTQRIDMPFYRKLGVQTLSDLLELAFTRVKLTFLNDEDSLFKVIASLVKQFGENPFSTADAIREISASQGFTDGYVFEVLRTLFRHDFLVEAEPAVKPASARNQADPRYVLQSREVFEFLREKTQAVQTDISTDEKLLYLKKVIPLSVKSAELDREKTREVLALSEAIGNLEMVGYLEEVFLEHLLDEKPIVRLTALNNVALLDSVRARDAIFAAMKDDDSLVREYAARNLALLAQKKTDPQMAHRIVEVLVESIDDESEAVRAQVYETLARYRHYHDLTAVFIKGMSDAADAVRITSVRNLSELEPDAHEPYVRGSLLDATDDVLSEVRKYACLGVQKYPGPDTLEALVRVLKEDADPAIRALAADSLSCMEEERALEILMEALESDAAEDVKLAVVRALGKRPGWTSEQILLSLLQKPEDLTPALLWVAVRSLGMAGGTERSLRVLADLRETVRNEIVQAAIGLSIRKIHGRIDELRQLERRLEAATPVAVAVPSEYETDVEIHDDEPID